MIADKERNACPDAGTWEERGIDSARLSQVSQGTFSILVQCPEVDDSEVFWAWFIKLGPEKDEADSQMHRKFSSCPLTWSQGRLLSDQVPRYSPTNAQPCQRA